MSYRIMQTLYPAFPLSGVQGYMFYSTVLIRLQPSRAVLSMVLLPSVSRVLLNVSSVQNQFWRTFLQLSRQKNRDTERLKNSHIFSQIRRKLGKIKVLWDWRNGSVLKSTCCFAEGSVWVPRAHLVEHNCRSSSSKGSFTSSSLGGYCMQVLHIHTCRKMPI